MKKVVVALLIIGMLLCLVDVDSMMIFLATKVIGIMFMLPSFLVFKFQE